MMLSFLNSNNLLYIGDSDIENLNYKFSVFLWWKFDFLHEALIILQGYP